MNAVIILKSEQCNLAIVMHLKATRAVRRSDYSPTIALSEEKDKLV